MTIRNKNQKNWSHTGTKASNMCRNEITENDSLNAYNVKNRISLDSTDALNESPTQKQKNRTINHRTTKKERKKKF